MSESIPCLLRVGDNVKKYKVIKLDREMLTVGRSGDVNYCIMSNMISRCHAVLKRQVDQTWSITDNKSLNGIFVNCKQLDPFDPHLLNDGDIVQFGVPTASNVPAEFVYKFYSSLKIRIEKKSKKFKAENQDSDTLTSDLSQSETTSEIDDRSEKRRKVAQNQCREEQSSDGRQCGREAEYKARLAEMEQLLKEKEVKQLEVEKQLEKEREERERKAQEVAELKEKEQAILLEMHDKQAQLEKEKDELKKKIQCDLEKTLKEKELALRAQLTCEKESLLEEKERVEKNLQAEMAKALEEKDKKVEEQLLKMKDDLDMIIHEKDEEQKLLECRLTETKEESELAKLKALKAKDDLVSDFADLMEMELQCSICNELFIKAMSLNCSHVFCKLCINQWMKVKKECPNCRAAITSQMQTIALDSYIDKMVERLSDDLKSRRKAMVHHRKAEEEKFSGAKHKPKPGTSGIGQTAARPHVQPSTTRVSNRIRGRQQRGRGRGRGRGQEVIPSAPHPLEIPGINLTPSAPGPSTSIAPSSAAASRAGPHIATTSRACPLIAATARAGPSIAATSRACPPTANPSFPVTVNAVAGAATAGTSSSFGAAASTTATTAPSEVGTCTPSTAAENSSIEISSTDEDEDEYDWRGRRHRRNYWLVSSESGSNNEDEEDGDDDDDTEHVDGIPGRYYGGYGHCFKCGARGHWANGCPNSP